MYYNLSFTRTYEGLLRVAVAIDSSKEALAIFEDDKAFLSLVRQSQLEPEVVAKLERAVIIAYSPRGSSTSCEQVHLTPHQLRFLHLSMILKLSA